MKITLLIIALIAITIQSIAQTDSEVAGNDKGMTGKKVLDEAATLKVDGIIKESEWKDARIFTDFHMMIPRSDSKDYDSTIAMIKQTKDAINIAIKYWPRGKIIRQSLTRDRSTDEENEFFIVLDLENKGQNGYIFVVSFLDNQRDAIVYNQRNQSYEWDWQWENKSKIVREPKEGQPGYVELEIKIPVDRIQNKNKKQIGIDLQLFSYTPDNNYFWYSLSPNSELLNLKNLHKFDLATPFDEKLNLRFNLTPYVMANKFNGVKGDFRYGGEFAVSLDKHKLKSTFHTDESTLEADPFRFSFYGRAIFLSEKRPFFSKDLDLFSTPINLFYTRAIQNIEYGFNYTYRSDKFKLGAVYVQEDTTQFAPGSKKKFIAVRPKFNFTNFNIGGLVVHTRDTLNNFKETVVNVDARIKLPSRFWFIPQFAKSFNNDSTTANLYNAYLFFEQNSNGGPYMDAYYARYDSNFQATTLFNNYGNDYDEISASGGYEFIKNSKYFPTINISGGYYRAHRLSDGFNYQNGANVNLFYKVTGWLSFFHNISYDRPNDVNEFDERITHSNILSDNNFKVVYGSHSISGGFYGGKYFGHYLLNPYASIDLSFLGKLRLVGNINYVQEPDVKRTIYSLKLDYKILDKLFLRTYFQRDTYLRRALWNTMVQYQFFGGSNVYLVLNLFGDRLENTGRYFKVSYEFNF
ncbi:MAG: hypothetical protein IT281_06020 [Ignavibacteria bacterium]|nr:hypothetical protein [Ignavibacteria bacterium]MCC7159073.1 hypothetical protein [Ignavibacteria bacterium]